LERKQVQHALETIERNAKTQAELIEDLLDVSRIITGQLRLDVRPVMAAPVVESAVASVMPAAEAKGIRLQTMLDPNAGPVAADSGRLQQVLWNLLSNAIKFTPRGGCVQVRVERINSHIEIIVSDTGQGIRREFLPYVFDRFRQADAGTTRQNTGLGLGLAIVRHLVELHGGSITADSPGEGHGATFAVRLPVMAVHWRKDEERTHPKAGTSRTPAGSCGRCLSTAVPRFVTRAPQKKVSHKSRAGSRRL
jgi:signal transduction histidine kinase